MGFPKLKKKIGLRYRKGSTDDSQNCSHCEHYVKEHPVYHLGGRLAAHEPRCKIMGLENSIRYRIRSDHRCDAHQTAGWWKEKVDRFVAGLRELKKAD